jgi:excisionase family DNA binding protein
MKRTQSSADRTDGADFILTSEAARILDVSSETVRLWSRTGKLRVLTTTGGVRLFDRQACEELAATRHEARQSACLITLGQLAGDELLAR